MKNTSRNDLGKSGAAKMLSLVFLLLTLGLGYWVKRADFGMMLGLYGALFACYWWFLRHTSVPLFQRSSIWDRLPAVMAKWSDWVWLGVFARLLLLFSLPNLSDDFYRFLWDGRLWILGIHPFSNTPEQLAQQGFLSDAVLQNLYPLLNSPRFYTVYPPVCQALFAGSAWISPNSTWGAVFVLKLFLFACELGTLYFLGLLQERIKPNGVSTAVSISPQLLYALNPLLIVEITGNVHFEGAMIFFMVLALYLLAKDNRVWSAVFWATATAAKLLPLLFVPLICAWLGLKKGLRFLVVYIGFCLMLFLPIFNAEVFKNMMKSIDLYFQKFEFNASLYYLFRELGYWQTGWNIGARIGPRLAVAVVASIGLMSLILYVKSHWLKTAKPVSLASLFTYLSLGSLLHLLCSTTVHPWYIAVPFLFALFSDAKLLLPMLCWTVLGLFSYSHYSDGIYVEKYGWVAAEYGALLFVVFAQGLNWPKFTNFLYQRPEQP